MIEVTVILDDGPVTYTHPGANGFRVQDDGDVIVTKRGEIVAIYVNRVDRVLRVYDPDCDQHPADSGTDDQSESTVADPT